MTTLSRSHTEHFVFCVKIATPKSVVFGVAAPVPVKRRRRNYDTGRLLLSFLYSL